MLQKIVLICVSNTENLAELAKIAAPNDKGFFNGADFSGADLRGTDLSGFDLSGANIKGAVIDNSTKIANYNAATSEQTREYIISIIRSLRDVLRRLENILFNFTSNTVPLLDEPMKIRARNFIGILRNKVIEPSNEIVAYLLIPDLPTKDIVSALKGFSSAHRRLIVLLSRYEDFDDFRSYFIIHKPEDPRQLTLFSKENEPNESIFQRIYNTLDELNDIFKIISHNRHD